MTNKFIATLVVASVVQGCAPNAHNGTEPQSTTAASTKKLYMDIHDLGAGNVTYEAVADAHKKDLATQQEFGVNLLKFWVDEQQGKVYCLAEANSEADLYKTHKKAHGLVPEYIYEVNGGPEALEHGKPLFLDTHYFEPGSVTRDAVAAAHQKDLATQGKYHANFVNYWLDEKAGVVMCLVEASDSLALINTHTEAHGLLPSKVERVKQGK